MEERVLPMHIDIYVPLKNKFSIFFLIIISDSPIFISFEKNNNKSTKKIYI
ncbi:NADH dehydrogenase subunit 5 [Iris pallida]|uniref:NADH dehydrogenase subunit 5 (Plastid) n=1 Tax=Iris pallida TaxID=29817 RepID=A0AAX6EQJ0_IRIPA|nr:NADH dehydrogenase subunit 5 [Iris pallida]